MADTPYKIELGVKLDTNNLQTEINKLDDKYKIKLGVDLGVEDIRKRISKYNENSNNAKLHLKIKLDTSDLKEQINKLDLSGKGEGISIPLNTASLETSLRELKEVIAEIKTSFNSLDGENMKSLLFSVNQIVTALGKAENESDSLVKSLSVLSKKEFGFNFNLKTGNTNPLKAATDYGKEARRNAIPALQEQASALQNLLGGYLQADKALERYLTKIHKASGISIKNSLIDDISDTSSIAKQMEAIEKYIGYLKKIASEKGIDLSGFDAQFSKTAENIVDDTVKIQTGAKQTEEALEEVGKEMKQIFGGGVSAEGLSASLEPIIKDLADIKKAFESLSSVGTIDGLTTSFKDLAEVLEKLTSNITIVKQNLDNIGSVGTSTGNTGIENLEQDLKQVETAAKKTSDSIKETVSESKKLNIDISDGGIDELETSLRRLTDNDDIIRRVTNEISQMGVIAKKVSGTLQGKDLVKFDVQGIQKTEDGLERVITLTKTLTKAQDGSFRWLDSSKQTQAINNDFEELKRRAKEISNLRIDIFKLDDISDISKASAELDKLTNEYDELFAKTKSGLNNKQISQLGNLVGSGDTKALREFNSELNEFVKLQKQIENTRFEIGKLEVVGGKQTEIETLKKQLEGLEDTYNRLMGTFMKKAVANGDILNLGDFSSLKNGITKATQDAENRLERFKSQYADTRAELARKIKVDIELGNFDDDVSRMQNKFDGLSDASKELRASVETVNDALTELKNASKINDDGVLDTERLIKAQEDYARAIEKTNNLIDIQARKDAADAKKQKLVDDRQVFQSKVDVWLKKNSAATEKFGEAMLKLKRQAENCDRVTLNHLESQFKKLDNAADKAGVKMMSLGDQIKSKFKEYSAYFSVAEVFMWVEQGLRSMFEQVKLIDSAMTELKKVTDETDETYNNFLTNTASRAKEIGTTIDGLVSSTADFARLGYEFADAQGLAEVANIYAVVGDDIDNIESATESLISTLTAFKKEANGLSSSDFAMNVVDKMNEVADTYSISSGGLGEALKRSASSMETANNSLDETIALITAANEVVQDPEVVGRFCRH